MAFIFPFCFLIFLIFITLLLSMLLNYLTISLSSQFFRFLVLRVNLLTVIYFQLEDLSIFLSFLDNTRSLVKVLLIVRGNGLLSILIRPMYFCMNGLLSVLIDCLSCPNLVSLLLDSVFETVFLLFFVLPRNYPIESLVLGELILCLALINV